MASRQLALAWAALWALVALVVQAHTLMNADNAWLLAAAQRMLSGSVPYADFYETNPPLILWLFCLPAFAAKLFGIAPALAFRLSVLVLAGASLALAWREIARHPQLAGGWRGHLVFAALAQVALGCPALVFGQREHLFMLLAMPYFIWATGGAGRPFGRREALLATLAGIGFCIKPFFALIWAAGALWQAVAARRARLLVSPGNLVVIAVGMGYVALALVFTPAYFTRMLPALALTYGGFRQPLIDVLRAGGGFALLYLLPLMLLASEPGLRAAVRLAAVWFAAACATVLLQGKGWLNYFYPMMFFGELLLALLLAPLLEGLISRRQALSPKTFALLWGMGFVLFALPAWQLVSTQKYQRYQQDYVERLAAYVQEYHAEGQPFYALSFNLGAAFPAAGALPVTFPFHFHHQWMLPGILAGEGSDEALENARRFALGTVAADMVAARPALVAVDTNRGLPGAFGRYDFIADLSRDPAFRQLWKNYRQVGQIDVQRAPNDWGRVLVFAREK